MYSKGREVPPPPPSLLPPREGIYIPAGANINNYLPKHLKCAPKESLVACPYDATHRVKESRLRGHIVKCERTHPALTICFYNATHRMPADQYPEHVKSCPSRPNLDPSKVYLRETQSRKSLIGPTIPVDEYWD